MSQTLTLGALKELDHFTRADDVLGVIYGVYRRTRGDQAVIEGIPMVPAQQLQVVGSRPGYMRADLLVRLHTHGYIGRLHA